MATSRLRDVAALAGVSIRTVSNAVNGYAPVAEDTRRRVEEAVAALDYRPNVLARNLKRGRSGLLAMVVPELDVAYFAELARAVINAAARHGYTVVLDQTDGDPARERDFALRDSRATLFDGVILSPLTLTSEELAQHDRRMPMVLLGEHLSDGGHDHVGIDTVAAAQVATTHLLQPGRTRVAAIGDQPYPTGETAQLRTEGYRRAHHSAGAEVDERLILPTRRFHRADGAVAMAQLLDSPAEAPEAVFCYNDMLALGALRTLWERGVRVPQDIAVIGFDNVDDGRYATPSLSTISPDKQQIATMAVDRLVQRLGSAEDLPAASLSADFRLVVRESSSSQGPSAHRVPPA